MKRTSVARYLNTLGGLVYCSQTIMSAGNWCLIESDPGVFTELIREFGCTGVQVEELWSLDESSFSSLRPVYGLIFLFKWKAGDAPTGTVVRDARLHDIFFAQQVIQNACATQALINLLLNCDHADLHLGSILSEFKTFTAGFDPANKGLCLSNSEQIRKVHNSFSRQHVFDFDVKLPEKEDVFHFITYIPYKGRVYELDGLQDGPIDLGKIPADQDWLDVVRPLIEQRIQRYSEGEIHFNLMAVISDKKTKCQKRLEELQQSGMDAEQIAEEISHLHAVIAEEDRKIERFRAENVRRKHNYIPFIMELLKVLAKEGKLVPLMKEAKEKAQKRADDAKKKKQMEKDAKKAVV